MLLLLLFLVFTPTSVRSNWASNIEAPTNPDDLFEKGILFNQVSKILLTEKFIRVEFLVPFPTYVFTMQPDIEKTWETPSLICPLSFLSEIARNSSGFKVNWMLHQIDYEISLAQQDLALIRNKTAMFLTPPKPPKSRWDLLPSPLLDISVEDLLQVVQIHVVYEGCLEVIKTNPRQMQKLYAALLIFKTLLLTTLQNL